MSIGNLDNCPRCGKLYVKNPSQLCPGCMKVMEEEYGKCIDYLRENRGCTIHELSDATNVTVRQIVRFIREGRISIDGNPNMGYPCESCGQLIRQGTLCPSCQSRLQQDLHRTISESKKQQDDQNKKGFYSR